MAVKLTQSRRMKKKTAERIYETTSYGPTTALEGVLGVGERKKGVERKGLKTSLTWERKQTSKSRKQQEKNSLLYTREMT